MSRLHIYLPDLYTDILETDELLNAEVETLDVAAENSEQVRNNQYVGTSDIQGVQQFEKMLGIMANPATEDLSFRKLRVINRLSTKPPFTITYLDMKLTELIGAGKYTISMDTENYTLYIESSAVNQIWAQEIAITLNSIKPANIVYINRPFLSETIVLSEEMSYNQIVYNYKLGTSWALGVQPFATLNDKGVIKLAEASSIKQTLLDGVALDVAEKVSSVLINDTLEISDFTLKEVTGAIFNLEYTVLAGQGVTEITNVKLLDSLGNHLTESTVYIPLLSDAIMKHKINIAEGV